ncbi:hypothetical protein [Peribacillus frigoritolerans]|uniref:Phosphoadenosine phosphosulphate reductase domain-containing protein n=1 Tax=Peribacillus castrilensis TaxID=2897690 RepID=A0AAW9NFZ9_9BACI|nr:hypothetical protein [Peribacillus castrilensis]
MKHVIFYSGGLGSWATANRVIEKHGIANIHLLFTDTFIEDKDLYRFLIETTQKMFGIDQSDLLALVDLIPPVSHHTMELRKDFLKWLAELTTKRNPHFHWISDGREPWETFKDARFIGNSRIAPCSHHLKQQSAKHWIFDNFGPEDTTLYLGIDCSETHRTLAPAKNWEPFKMGYPLVETDTNKDAVFQELAETDIELPNLYKQGFSHNNCGGACVRGGQAHFLNLLKTNRDLYIYHEEKEQAMREYLDKDVAILRRTRNKVKTPLTLRSLRLENETDTALNQFKSKPPSTVRVFDAGVGKNRILKLTEDKTRYITGNVGTSNRRVFHYWSFENAFKAQVKKEVVL